MKAIQAAVLMLASASAGAQTITVFESGFEPGEGYVIGKLNGQQGWLAYLGEDPNFGDVVATNPLSGSQSVLLDGKDVLFGSFGRYAGVGVGVLVPPTLNGVPLSSIEVTGLASIVDPGVVPGEQVRGGFGLYGGVNDEHFVAGGYGITRDGSHRFGFIFPKSVVVSPGVSLGFRKVIDYTAFTGSLWVNGEPVYVHDPGVIFNQIISDAIYLEMVSDFSNLAIDTRVWLDDISVKATYGSCYADCDASGGLSIDDFICFQTSFAIGDPYADCDADGVLSIDDFICFQTFFAIGC